MNYIEVLCQSQQKHVTVFTDLLCFTSCFRQLCYLQAIHTVCVCVCVSVCVCTCVFVKYVGCNYRKEKRDFIFYIKNLITLKVVLLKKKILKWEVLQLFEFPSLSI